MEITKVEVERIQEVAAEILELNELQLALVGGGIGNTIL